MKLADCLVRDFRSTDQNCVRELVLRGLGERFGSIDRSLNPDLDDIAANYHKKGHKFFVAESAGSIVGCAGLVRDSVDIHRIVRMAVLKAFRRRGMARALLLHCVNTAIEAGSVEIRAFTQPEWRDAVSFYRGQGFSQYAADDIDIHLRRRLAPHCQDRPN